MVSYQRGMIEASSASSRGPLARSCGRPICQDRSACRRESSAECCAIPTPRKSCLRPPGGRGGVVASGNFTALPGTTTGTEPSRGMRRLDNLTPPRKLALTAIIDSDYLIVGAGGMGLAFADEIVTQTSASVTIVDRNHRPGGHWNDAYPFVRLHQASACYGVNSTPLGRHSIDPVGWNKGCYELASGSEVVAYFDQVMRQRFLPSGRVKYLPMSEYLGDGRVVSRGNGNEYEIRAQKIVDATYINVAVPSQRPPRFTLAAGVACAAPNSLPKLAPEYRHFVVIGSGKTGIDSCLFLLEHGVAPANITWVMPNDAWLFDRFTVNPGRHFTAIITAGRGEVLRAALAANSTDDFFR